MATKLLLLFLTFWFGKCELLTGDEQTTPEPEATTPPYYYCFYKGKWYPPGEDVFRKRNNDDCTYGAMCQGHYIRYWEDPKCSDIITVTPTRQGQRMAFCKYGSRTYRDGQDISQYNSFDGCIKTLYCSDGVIKDRKSDNDYPCSTKS